MSRRSVIRPSPATFSYGRQRSFLKRETPHGGTGSGRFCLRGIPLLTFFPHPTRVSRGCGSVGRASPCQGEGRGFESRHPLGRLAQRERASLTRKRSLVRSQYRPPGLKSRRVRSMMLRTFSCCVQVPCGAGLSGVVGVLLVVCVTARLRSRRRALWESPGILQDAPGCCAVSDVGCVFGS